MDEKNAPGRERENKIQTGFRTSESQYEEIEQMAKEYEISRNALMNVAMRIGLNSLKGVNQIQSQQLE